MQGYESKALRRSILTTPRGRQEPDEGVDHDIADEMNSFLGNAFAKEIDFTVLGRREQNIGEAVGHNPVDFLRHGSIEGPQSGLNVTDRNQQLRADESRSNSGIHVAINQSDIGLAFQNDGLEPEHDLRRLRSVASRTDRQIEIRIRNLKLRQKHVRHVPIIVLSGVNQRLPDASLPNRPQYWGRFHKIRPGPNNMENVIHSGYFICTPRVLEAGDIYPRADAGEESVREIAVGQS